VSETKLLAERLLEADTELSEGLKARINELFSGVSEHGFN
jgi:hypothetical protein